MEHTSDSLEAVDKAVAEGGAYEIIQKRLESHGESLGKKTAELNQLRLQEFGESDMKVLSRIRVRTDNNCIARDIVRVGKYLLFGYNVFIGLKKETKIEDVFSLFTLEEVDGTYEMVSAPLDDTFLYQTSFINDFNELYRYYKHTKLCQLTIKDGKLLAGFQIGERPEDIRVFRWSLSPDQETIQYIDNRGERDIQLPPRYDFEWIETTRDDIIHGRHAHINILDTVFVETINGDLTIKIENNTEDGLGIYSEPVDDKTQSLDDGHFSYAKVGDLILLKILPYREDNYRHLIYNTLTNKVIRVDAIGQSCVQLPEDHGLIFPGGYYLQTGEFKTFDEEFSGLNFKRSIRSPNGEDVLYIFYEPIDGVIALFTYNMINKVLQNPIYAHGYALSEDGTLVIFSAEQEPTRVHPMQVWRTPYESAEFASKAPTSQSFYGKIGNAEMVRGISDLFSICRLIGNQSVSLRLYEELIQASTKIFDNHYWLDEEQTTDVAIILKQISDTAELVVDEFEKVQSIRQQSDMAMQQAESDQLALIQEVQTKSWESADDYAQAIGKLRRHRGHLTTLKDQRYVDEGRIDSLTQQLLEAEEDLSRKTVAYLAEDNAFEPYMEAMEGFKNSIEAATTRVELQPLIDSINEMSSGLDLISDLIGTLKVQDSSLKTRIIDSISLVYSQVNQTKASAKHKHGNLGAKESEAEFSAQFKLLSQSVTNALGQATTPEKCEEQLSRLLAQLEDLESQFSEHDQFLTDIIEKRDELFDSFEAHKQTLLDAQQRKAQSTADAAFRILNNIEKRSLKFTQSDELNTYFSSDALVQRVKDLENQLRSLDNSVKADEVSSRLKNIKDQAIRSLRDKTDLFEDGGGTIKLGPRHKFSVNQQELALTIIPRQSELYFHLTGTNYYERVDDADLQATQRFWDMPLASETPSLYRSEHLASLIIESADNNTNNISWDLLYAGIKDSDQLEKSVRDFSVARYKEGYEKGIHDHDATVLLKRIIPAMEQGDLLKFDPFCRALAQTFWNYINHSDSINSESSAAFSPSCQTWPERAQSALQMQRFFSSAQAKSLLVAEVKKHFLEFLSVHPIPATEFEVNKSSEYLVEELARDRTEFICSKYAVTLFEELKRALDDASWKHYQSSLSKLQGLPAERWKLSAAWFASLISSKDLSKLEKYIPEAVALVNCNEKIERRHTDVDLELSIEGLLGEHPSIENRQLCISLDSFLQRTEHHRNVVIPQYHEYLSLRHKAIEARRKSLRLEEFQPKPLSSFVRNRLINESYLPLIGDNLAKQMGTVGDSKRTDLMGLLMMISPPGYGKTTLMEYVASRLGLIFMKINCPSLGHDVISLDPEQSPNATAEKELIKLNLALEMGNNVMLYLDDIQHTHPEFLQKFISLCDGTRRIEGVWQGETKTYDMRGRKFCVVMAGNPYTESGETFKIPDMLANRADIYNLGDILGGMDEQFALSYIENALTSNPVLAPLALRDMEDVYQLIKLAKGDSSASGDLSHPYSGAELNEIKEVLKKMFVIQDVLLKINQQYIASAAQNDKYRTEPPFKLQGSYRNMNKMTEKISAVMNHDELMQMIDDHYLGESQLLTTGAEDNLLKLSEIRGTLNEDQNQRWSQIKSDFLRNKAMGGDDTNVGAQVVAQLNDLVNSVDEFSSRQSQSSSEEQNLSEILSRVLEKISEVTLSAQPTINVVNEPVPGVDQVLRVLADTVEHTIAPLVRTMEKKFDIDLRTHDKMTEISNQLRSLQAEHQEKEG